ncbi:MAG: hypothetical protein FJ161_00180 [Gammaproteobacteria bacterium]|nr:hypothetical protein [Gammaproteobacteria bacterium]
MEIPALSLRYFDSEMIFHAPAWKLLPGSATHVLGRNGAGKTTYLKALLQYLDSHEVCYIGHTHPFRFFRSTHDIRILSGNRQSILPDVEQLDRYSQGQQTIMRLLSCLDLNKAVWILDEPWINLDQDLSQELNTHLQNHLMQEGAIVFTSHSMPAYIEWRNIQFIELQQSICDEFEFS